MQKEKKILFLHGFYASGSCVPALALNEAFEKRATVLTPDLPLHPANAIKLIREIYDQEKPDVLVGNSCGSFYAQMISPIIGVPALLGNPHFKMSDFLRERIGNHQYKSPRANGIQDFTIDEGTCMGTIWGRRYTGAFRAIVFGALSEQLSLSRWSYTNGRTSKDLVCASHRKADDGASLP